MTNRWPKRKLPSFVRLAVLLLSLLGIPLIGVYLLPVLDAPSLRSVLSSFSQVLGVLLAATVVTYVFWANGTRSHFERYTKVLEKVGEVATKMGDPTRVRYKSAIGLAGASVERNLSEPYKPPGIPVLLPERAGDKWRTFYDGYQELEARVFRRAYLYVLTTLVILALLLMLFDLGLGIVELLARESSWLGRLVVIAFSLCLTWFVVLMTLLLRPGGGIVISVEKREADGKITWFTPEFF